MAGVFTTSFWTPETTASVLATLWRTTGTAASVGVASAFWERKVSNCHYPSNGTHVEDLKNLVQVHPPSGNSLFVFLHVETPRDRIPFNPLEELLLNTCYDPAVESIISGSLRCMSLVKLTPKIGLSHHTRTDRLRPLSSHSSLGPALGRRLRKATRVRHDPDHSPQSPSYV